MSAADDAEMIAAQLRALVPAPHSVQSAVAEIIMQVRIRGDEAVHDYTQRFDTRGVEPKLLRVEQSELDAAVQRLNPAVRAGLERAIENVGAVAAGWDSGVHTMVKFPDHEVLLRTTAVRRAAVYVPGGRAPYPSTVVMGVITAKEAGVSEVVVCAPPGEDGEVDSVVLAACSLTGASAMYRMGGAQAIAALAYGTASVAPVAVIVGPGNLYVQEAKRQVFGQVGIDGFAGPSDLVIIADPDADPEPLALDLLAQAEHGPGTLTIGISGGEELLERLAEQITGAPESGAIAALVRTGDPVHALELAQAFAPEHLQLVGAESEALAPRATHAGCVFVGPSAGTAFGDYIAGSNHILPTNGAARFASALSPGIFLRSFSEVRIRDGSQLARDAAPVARAEGFEVHARSMEARIRDNGQDGENR
jgi:histidinol dehydrogenase